MRIPSPFASAWFRYLAIVFGLLRYLAASKARALRIGQLLCSYFPFAFSPSSTSRPLFRWLFRLAMACTDLFSFRAIDGMSRPDASNVKSCASSAGVHGRPVGRGPSFILLSPSAPTRPAGGWPRGGTNRALFASTAEPFALFAGYDGKAAELGNRQSRRRPHGVTPGRLSYALDCPALRRDIVRIVSTLHDG